jgi:hypothetical protein
MLCTLAKLEKDKLDDIQSLEKSLGKTLIAFSCKDINIVPLKEEELSKIKQVEEKLKISLVAVK